MLECSCLGCDEDGADRGGLPPTSDSLHLHLRQRTAVHLHNLTSCVAIYASPAHPLRLLCCVVADYNLPMVAPETVLSSATIYILKPRRGQQNSTVEAMMYVGPANLSRAAIFNGQHNHTSTPFLCQHREYSDPVAYIPIDRVTVCQYRQIHTHVGSFNLHHSCMWPGSLAKCGAAK